MVYLGIDARGGTKFRPMYDGYTKATDPGGPISGPKWRYMTFLRYAVVHKGTRREMLLWYVSGTSGGLVLRSAALRFSCIYLVALGVQ